MCVWISWIEVCGQLQSIYFGYPDYKVLFPTSLSERAYFSGTNYSFRKTGRSFTSPPEGGSIDPFLDYVLKLYLGNK